MDRQAAEVGASTHRADITSQVSERVWPHLELLAGGVRLDNLLQHPPVGAGAVLGDAAAGQREVGRGGG